MINLPACRILNVRGEHGAEIPVKWGFNVIELNWNVPPLTDSSVVHHNNLIRVFSKPGARIIE